MEDAPASGGGWPGLRSLAFECADSLLDFLFPPVCLSCGNLRGEGEEFLCASCWKTIHRLSPGDPLLEDMRRRLMADAPVAGLVSLFAYEKEAALQSVIHALKYNGVTSAGRFLGKELGAYLRGLPDGAGISAIIPVPLHRSKQRERGYNQSVLLARAIAGVLSVDWHPRALRRMRYTGSQTALSSVGRNANVAGAFRPTDRIVRELRGRTVALVDDVITTGATVRECARMLRAAGTGPIIVCSVALASNS